MKKGLLILAVITAYAKAQELTTKYSKELPKGETPWYKNKRIRIWLDKTLCL